MRYSVKSLLLLSIVVAICAAMAGAFLQLDKWERARLLWLVPVAGLCGGMMAIGTTIGWVAARQLPTQRVSMWLGFTLSVTNWMLYTIVRYTLYQTSNWYYEYRKVSGLTTLEWLGRHYLVEATAILFQIAIVIALTYSDPKPATLVGCAILIFWFSVICIELWLCAISGLYFSESLP